MISFPVEVLGPGRRLGIWFQGCSQRCPGCFSPHTREFEEHFRMPLTEVAGKIGGYSLFTDKLTISGGEPFAQPDFLRGVIRTAREKGYNDIFVYSGLELAALRTGFADILDLIDILVDGAFRQDLPTKKIWRGSENQVMHILTRDPALRESYAPFVDAAEDHGSMQVIQSRGSTILIGIPRHPDLTGKLSRT